SARSGHFHLQGGAHAEVFGVAEPGSSEGVADLLVVGPVLAEIASGIHPDRNRSGPDPRHRAPEGVQVHGLPELDDLTAGGLGLVDEQAWAGAAGGGHTSLLGSRRAEKVSPSAGRRAVWPRRP